MLRAAPPSLAQRNAVAIVIWRARIVQFLEHMTDVQTSKRGDSGGKTRDYLRFMLTQDAVIDAFASLALFYLSVYMPVCGAITHVDNVFDMAGISQGVYTQLLEIGAEPERLVRDGFALFEQYKSVKIRAKLAEVLAVVRGDGDVKPEVLEMVGAIAVATAIEWHHHTLEWQLNKHPHSDEELIKSHDAQWLKRGGAHLRKADWERERSACVSATNCLVERVFGLRNYIDDKTNGTLRADYLEGHVMCRYNKTIQFYLDKLRAAPAVERKPLSAKLLRAMRAVTSEREARIGDKAAQYKRNGLIAKEKDDALLAAAAKRREKDAAEREALERIELAGSWDALKALSLDALRQQVRARKKLHGEVGLNISAASSYFNALRLLVVHLKLNVPDADVRAAAAAKRVNAVRRPRAPRAQRNGQWGVESLLGAVTAADGSRKYLVHWEGCDADDATFEPYESFITVAADGGTEINAELERQLIAFDAVVDDDLEACARMHERAARAMSCALALGARVLVDQGEGYAAGAVAALPPIDGAVDVTLDGATQPTRYSRDQLLAVEPEESLGLGDRVRVAYDDDDAPLTKRRWFYGKIVAIDARRELVSVDFDNGETLRGMPFFDLQLVFAAPAERAPKRVRR